MKVKCEMETKDVLLRELFLDLCKLINYMHLDDREQREIKRIGQAAEKLFAETQFGINPDRESEGDVKSERA